MSWLKRLTKNNQQRQTAQAKEVYAENPASICCDAFKSHWLQICEVINATSPNPVLISTTETRVAKREYITADDVNVVQNVLEQMIFLLSEEQNSGDLCGPILEFVITRNVFGTLYEWWDSLSTFKEKLLLILLKVYEVLISQAQHSLLHHKQLVGPMLKFLSSTHEPRSEELDGHIVLLLNLLCVWMNRDPLLLEVFFDPSSNHGPANFMIFSLLIEYIHKEGTVGQQARDALLLCMALSAENPNVANYIVQSSNFCPVLAVGLSGIYSTLPRNMEVRADDWHCLQRSDWSQVPELANFMNSFEFCNSVIEVAHDNVSEQLLDFFYNGFLVSVFGPSLHKTSANEVVVTTAYLNLFLRSVTAPALMRCFLRFLLTHCHESSFIVNTLIQRIASGNRLALVSLSLIRTLVDLNCEDLMLQLVYRHLIPCQHILASQRRAIRDVDIHNASASRFLALTPAACRVDAVADEEEQEIFTPIERPDPQEQPTSETARGPLPGFNENITQDVSDGNNPFHSLLPPPPLRTPASRLSPFYSKSQNHESSPAPCMANSVSEYTVNEDLSVTVNMHSGGDDLENSTQSQTITSPNTMAEFGPGLRSQLELNTSYMDYLEDAKITIAQCREACHSWSASYDGVDPPPEGTEERSAEIREDIKNPTSSSTSIPPHDNKRSTSIKMMSPQDLGPSNTSDTAIRALSATYQTLNLTALALNGSSTSLDHIGGNCSFTGEQTSVVEQESSPTVHKDNSKDTLNETPEMYPHKNPDVESNVADLTDGKYGDPIDVEVSENDQVTAALPVENDPHTAFQSERAQPEYNDIVDDPNVENEDSPSIDLTTLIEEQGILTESEKTSKRGSSVTSSSVDEFFRSLMEIVPKTTRDKIEESKTNAISGNMLSEEDIESGIEVSSEGDAQATTPHHTITYGEEFERSSQQNADSMSQLSLSTEEMDEVSEKIQKDQPSEGNTKNVDLDETTARSESLLYDTDDEFDDAESLASSSFYEATDEYGPTEVSVSPTAPLKLQGIPYTGPLIGNLFAKLDLMVSNSLYENLLLTGIVTRLAAYPHPLLRSFLLNTHMVFHPSVRSLYQVLNSARNKIDSYAAKVTDFKVLVRRAQKYLLVRGSFPFSTDARTRNIIEDRPMPVPRVKGRTLGNMFARRKPKERTANNSLLPNLETLLELRDRNSESEASGYPENSGLNTASRFYITQRMRQRLREEKKMKELRTKNAVYASIVLAEFLKELAAVAQEHAVVALGGR